MVDQLGQSISNITETHTNTHTAEAQIAEDVNAGSHRKVFERDIYIYTHN